MITGGGSGIGQAIALLFAAQGANIHIIELTEAAGLDTQRRIQEAGGTCMIHACNVANHDAMMKVFEQLGNFDILINNAGIAFVGAIETTAETDFDRIMAVNVKGVYNAIKATIPMMKQQESGVILNIASVAALVGIPDRFAYSTSKGAVLAMTLSIAKDYLKHNIRCNSISPARIHTPFVDGFLEKNYPEHKAEMFEKLSKSQPIGRMGTPEEVAALALYLCSDEAGFLTGCDYVIDGGFVKLNN